MHLSIFLLTFYMDRSRKVHSKDLFSEITASMNLNFHVQHDQMPGLDNDKIQLGQESKMPDNTKNSKTNKIQFFSRTAFYICLKFCTEHKHDHGVQNY